MATAGPAAVLATTPVSTKMPVPMITPTPKTARSRPERFFLSWCSGSSVSRMDSSTLLTRARLVAMRCPSRAAGVRDAARLVIMVCGEGPTGPAVPHAARRPDSRQATAHHDQEVPVPDTERTTSTTAAARTAPPVALPPTLRPRPASAPRVQLRTRRTDDPVVDCAVYVRGERQDVD